MKPERREGGPDFRLDTVLSPEPLGPTKMHIQDCCMHCVRHSIAAAWPLAKHRPFRFTPAHSSHLSHQSLERPEIVPPTHSSQEGVQKRQRRPGRPNMQGQPLYTTA